jgi:membrane protease YdiL (CAAX protease family)
LGLVAYLAMMPIVFGHMVVNWLLLRAMGIEPVLQDVASYLLEQASPAAAAYKGFTAVVLAPVAEELLFRGIAFPVLARKLNSVVAMVVVSALFAAIHGEMSVMLPLFVVSLSLCAGYLATRTVLVPVIMHMLFNVTNLWLMSVLLDRPAP